MANYKVFIATAFCLATAKVYEAYNEVKALADSGCEDKEIEEFAIRLMLEFASEGHFGIKPDPVQEEKYRSLLR